MDQHISRFGTNTDDSDQLPNDGVGPGLSLLLQSFLTSVLDLSDLASTKPSRAISRCSSAKVFGGSGMPSGACTVARRSAAPRLRGGRPAQGWFEVANAHPGQGGLYPVDNARAFPHQAFALPIGPLGVLFGNCWYPRHAAMAPFSTQPSQKPALQQLGVEPVGFRPAMFP
jgi:hypothetical protein